MLVNRILSNWLNIGFLPAILVDIPTQLWYNKCVCLFESLFSIWR